MAQYDLLLTQNVHATLTEYSEKFVNVAKGGLISAIADQTPTVLAGGTDGYVLARDDAEDTGLNWIDPLNTYTFENGITESGGTVSFGGLITSNRTIESTDGSSGLILDLHDGAYNVYGDNDIDPYQFKWWQYDDINGINHRLHMRNSGTTASFTVSVTDSSGTMDMVFSTSGGMTVTDGINTKGLIYDDDYSIAGIADDRWIPDWAAVKSILTDNLIYIGDGTDDITLGAAWTYLDQQAWGLNILGSAAFGGTNNNGGSVDVSGGQPIGTARGGSLTLSGGIGINTAGSDGGHVFLLGGSPASTDPSSSGGDVHISPGNNNPAGETGSIYLGNTNTNLGQINITLQGTEANMNLDITPKGTGWLGSSKDVHVDNIVEYTAEAGVTIEGVLLKDTNLYCFDLETDNITLSPDSSLTFGLGVAVNTIETTLTDDDTHLPTSGAVFDAISGVGSGDVSWGTATNTYIVLGSASGEVQSSSDLTLTAGQVVIDYVTGGGLTVEYNGTPSGYIDASSSFGLRLQSPNIVWVTSTHATTPRIAIGDLAAGDTYVSIRDTSNTATTTLGVYNASNDLTFSIYETGVVYIPELGDNDAEDHVIAINDTTGLLTKRSVSSINEGIVSFGTTTQIPYTNLTGDDLLYASGFTFDGTDFAAPGDGSFADQLYVGDRTAKYMSVTQNSLVLASTGSSERSGIEMVGNSTSSAIASISFHNTQAAATDKRIAQIDAGHRIDPDAGYINFYAADNLGILSSILYVDGYNSRIGVNNASPNYGIDLTGTARISTSLRVGGTTLTSGYILELSGTSNKGRAADWTATSDVRLKTNIQPFRSVLDGIMDIHDSPHGLSLYNRRILDENGKPTSLWSKEWEVGFIAQDMLDVFPEVVNGSEVEFYDISYMRVGAIALMGVAELKDEKDREIEELKGRVDKLENKLAKYGNNHN